MNEKISEVLSELKDQSATSLNREIKNYLERNSFSTLDILLTKREILSLEVDDLYEKIIKNHRGGYCFEHNKLFHFALKSKGFSVVKQLARVIYGKDIDAPRTHRINIVTVEGEDYLVDVGFGAHTPNALIPMDGESIVCPNGGTYRVKENERGLFSLDVLREEGFFSFYTFDMGEYSESDFNLSSYFSNTHPKSKHAHNLVMSINQKGVTKAILNGSVTTFKGGEKLVEEINSSTELQELIESDFHLKLTEKECNFLFENFCRK